MNKLTPQVLSFLGKRCTQLLMPVLLVLGLMAFAPNANAQRNKCAYFKAEFSSKLLQGNNTFVFEAKSNAKNCKHILYTWSFGDGTKALISGQKVVHNFAKAGTYKVCVKAFNKCDSCIATFCKTVTVKGTKPCLVKLDFNVRVSGNTVYYGARSNLDPAKYVWILGEGGARVTGQTIKHTYKKPGTYTVCVRVYGKDKRCTKIICKKVVIKGNTKPCTLKGNFRIKVKGNKIYVYGKTNERAYTGFIFGDGSYARGNRAKHRYKKPGTYNVCFFAISKKNPKCKIKVCKKITIKAPCNIRGNFKFRTSGNAVKFWAYSKGGLRYTWNFGDGTFARGKDAKHTYKKAGVYKVCLTIYGKNRNCKKVICKKVIIRKKPCRLYANFRLSQHGNSIKVAAYGNGRHFAWSFGDGGVAAGRGAKHTYKKPGKYRVCLIVFGKNKNCKKIICKYVIIKPKPKKCVVNFRFKTRCLTAYFSGTTTPSAGSTIYWNYGDGTTGTGNLSTHTYASAGTYTVCATMVNRKYNCKERVCYKVEVKKCDTPKCKVDFKFKTKCLNAHFAASGSPALGSVYYWNFGDNTSATGANVNHTYNTAGTYEVCVTMVNRKANCKVKKCYKVTVKKCNPCNIKGTMFYKNYCPYLKLEANTNGTFVKWYLNNNYEGTGKTQKWKLKPGTHTICYVAYDSTRKCSVKVCKKIVMPKCNPCKVVANFKFQRTSRSSYTYKFTNLSTGGAIYSWSFGDGNTSTIMSPSHTYKKSGIYKVCLTVWDKTKMCKETKCYTLVIRRSALETDAKVGSTNTTVYPNPASDVLNFKSSVAGNINVEVLSMNGQVIINKSVSQNNTLNISQLSEGMYLVRTTNANGDVSFSKIQKN